jgi:hypothetical protein
VLERDAIVDSLYQIIGRGKILVTCRYKIGHDRVFPVELPGLLGLDGAEFLKMEIEQQGIKTATDVSDADINKIVTATGGSPLIMSLVAGQLEYKPPEEILRSIEAVKVDYEPLYEEIYRFMYRDSLRLISETAQNVLISLANLVPMIGADEDVLIELNEDIEPTAVMVALKTLHKLSLVELRRGRVGLRYALHPLTHYVLNSDIAYVTKD